MHSNVLTPVCVCVGCLFSMHRGPAPDVTGLTSVRQQRPTRTQPPGHGMYVYYCRTYEKAVSGGGGGGGGGEEGEHVLKDPTSRGRGSSASTGRVFLCFM